MTVPLREETPQERERQEAALRRYAEAVQAARDARAAQEAASSSSTTRGGGR